MNKKHLNIDELTRYFLTNLSRDNETKVQEHLSSCAECSKRLGNIRLLKKSIFEADDSYVSKNKPSFKILSSNWMRFAAAAVLVIGMGVSFYLSNNRGFVQVNEGMILETVLSLDSLAKEDSMQYYCPDEKYDCTYIDSPDATPLVKPD